MTIIEDRTEPEVAGLDVLTRMLVVVPTLDERENIERLLRRVRAALPGGDILVVDDASQDGTPERAEALAGDLGQIRVLRRTGHRGLGPAYRAGLAVGLADGYDVVLHMDADLSHDPDALVSLVEAVRRGADLAVGSRYVAGGGTVNWSQMRRLLSRAGGTFAARSLHLGVRDATSGFRAYRADLLRAMDLSTLTSNGFGFHIEMTDRARATGAVIEEVPIVFTDRTAGTSKMSGSIVREAAVMVTRRALGRRR